MLLIRLLGGRSFVAAVEQLAAAKIQSNRKTKSPVTKRKTTFDHSIENRF
jgi:hypothetical protein